MGQFPEKNSSSSSRHDVQNYPDTNKKVTVGACKKATARKKKYGTNKKATAQTKKLRHKSKIKPKREWELIWRITKI